LFTDVCVHLGSEFGTAALLGAGVGLLLVVIRRVVVLQIVQLCRPRKNTYNVNWLDKQSDGRTCCSCMEANVSACKYQKFFLAKVQETLQQKLKQCTTV